MKLSARLLATIITVAVLVLVLASWELFWREPKAGVEPVTVTIEEGATLNQVARLLREQDVLENDFLFKYYARFKGFDTKIMSGSFELTPGSSVVDLLDQLTSVKIEETEITIVEGWSTREIANYLAGLELGTVEEFYGLVGEPAVVFEDVETQYIASLRQEYGFLEDKPSDVGLEGYLFPDTYRIYREATLDEIVHKMLDNFELKISEELLGAIEQQNRSLHEVITMASIIEREVRDTEDRKMVADIFWRRLEIGMALQADSTVNYVTGGDTPAISLEDRDVDSAFNTYKYPGLPPGPIASPGLDAIEAAVYPTANDYWYFLTDSEGEVHYAKTNQEHAANKAKYLR